MKDTLVLIDDEPIARMDFCEIFEEAGYEVVGQASDGYDAIELCRAKRPDIALMDVKMPIFDGLSAAEVIIGEELCDCVILVTAYSDDEFIERAKRAGVMGYLVKPLDEKTLLPAVSIALAKSREIRKTRDKMAELSKNIDDHKIIEQAKGILARAHGISETEAYGQLRRLGMDKRCPVAEIAKFVVETGGPRAEVNKAKAVLSNKHGLSESEAYTRLKEHAKKNRVSLEEAAKDILRNR
ncbi:MAG: ANTAR domain-containing protein [Planctomycetaceae bacterium]|nr:ANTAR domain-containing protein [Planctomycetaceae bacterium]